METTDREVFIVDMRVSSEQIRSYVAAQSKIAKQSLPEESRKLILRLPTDSVDISPEARALAKGRLRVQIDDDGRYTKVTDDGSNPMMKLLEEGMRDVKKSLDRMKEITELMEDEEIAVEDRYAMQMKLVDLEGEFEKRLYKLNEDYKKLAADIGLPAVGGLWSPDGQSSVADLMEAGVAMDSKNAYLTDRTTGEIFAYRKYSDFIDKRTELKKEMIQRVYMRELDPEAFEEYAEKLREAYRAEFKELADENGNIWKNWNTGATELKEITADLTGTTFPTNKGTGFAPDETAYTGIDMQSIVQNPPSEDAGGTFHIFPEVNMYEYNMEKYVEDKLAKLEEDDYEEFNAMRVSVMSAEMAEESSDFLEKLTNQLTEQFQKFAAINELVGEEDFSQERDDTRMRQIAQIAMQTMRFLTETLLGGIQKDAAREAGKDNYNVKFKKTESPMEGVRDIFAPIP